MLEIGFRVSLCLVIVIGVNVNIATAQVIDDPGKEERIRVLVELLASKNPAPKRREGEIRVPENYDRNAQVIVFLAIQQLLVEGADAFEVLLAHQEDERYSFSFHGVQGDGNLSVAGACHWIVKQSVECYASEIHYLTRDQDFVYLFRDGEADSNLSEWWKKNRARPLWELQIEAIDQQIRFMRTVDWKTARDPFLDGGKLDQEDFETHRKENLAILLRLKNSIEAMKQPFRPKMLHLQRAWMGLLPWPTINPGT